jgi:hypothetical protein
VNSGAPGAQNVNKVFFMVGVGPYRFDKKRPGTRYAKLVFLHPVGSVGHVVYSIASGAQNVVALFFMLRWAQGGFYQKHIRTRYAELLFLHPVGSLGHVVHYAASGTQNVIALFSCFGETGTDSTKSVLEHVTLNSCFCIRWDLWAT